MAAALCAACNTMNANRLLVIGLVLVCLAAASAWFLANFERRTENEWVGFQGKARREPWLAAERLLRRMGATAAVVRALPELDHLPLSATLILPKGRQTLNLQSRRSVLNWVNRGGRLIVEAEPAYQRDPLLDALGVQRKIVTRADKPKHDARGSIARELIEIDMPKGSAPVKVQLDRSIDLQANRALVRYGDPYGTAVLLLQHGRGHVLVLNALDMFSNPLIGMHDHAEFLWRIVQVENYKPKVYFFDDPKKLSLFDWLRTHAWPAVAGTLLFLAAWLWSAMPRLGPIMPDPQRARRRLLDHLRASGRFLWAHGGSKLLVDAAREACLRRIARVHPDLLGLPESERQAHLKELLGLDAEQAGRLFSAATPARMIDFVHAIRLYQTVQESLARKRLTTQNKKATR